MVATSPGFRGEGAGHEVYASKEELAPGEIGGRHLQEWLLKLFYARAFTGLVAGATALATEAGDGLECGTFAAGRASATIALLHLRPQG